MTDQSSVLTPYDRGPTGPGRSGWKPDAARTSEIPFVVSRDPAAHARQLARPWRAARSGRLSTDQDEAQYSLGLRG